MFALPMAIYGIISIFNPEFTVDMYEYQRYLNEEMSDQQYRNLLLVSSKAALQDFIIESIILVASIVLWAFHWGIAKSKEPTN